MIFYIKLGKVRGFSVEINQNLGIKPFCNKNSFCHETVIDIPYVQIVYTSARWRAKKRVPIRSAANVNKKTKSTTKSTKRINHN